MEEMEVSLKSLTSLGINFLKLIYSVAEDDDDDGDIAEERDLRASPLPTCWRSAPIFPPSP